MIGVVLLLVALGAVVGVIWWDRTEKSKKRQVFFSVYNKSLAKAKDDKKIYGTSVNILNIIDETDISPSFVYRILKGMEGNNHVKVTQNTVKLTPEGVAYFKYMYLSETVKEV